MASHQQSVQRRSGGSGGSMQTKPRKNRSIRERQSALDRAKDTLGADTVARLQETYKSLDSKWGGAEHDQAEGMVIALLRQGLPDAQVRAVFEVGGSMIARLKAVIKMALATCTLAETQNPQNTRSRVMTLTFSFRCATNGSLRMGFHVVIAALGNISSNPR